MIKNSFLFTLICGIAYAYLFYHGGVGLNVFIFDAVVLLLLFRLRPELSTQTSFRWAVAALLPAALAVVVVNSPTSVLAHHVSFLLLLGFAQTRELRFIWFGLVLGVNGLLRAPLRALRTYNQESTEEKGKSRLRSWLSHAALPLLVCLPFLTLYTLASPDFSRGIDWFTSLFVGMNGNFSFGYAIALSLLGVLFTLPLAFPRDELHLTETADNFSDELTRNRKKRKPGHTPKKILGLKDEYRRGLLTFALLNLLILCVNFTDLHYIWLRPENLSAATLSTYVHEGTSNLVISLILAMLVVIYYFRENQNFYSGNKHLKPLAFLWLGQNALLALSVGVRNWHYISEYGLAYGRIQIGFVLLLILVGLFTLYRKVSRGLSFSYLLQANGLALWLFLIAFGSVNWVGVITRVNLQQADEKIDWPYLLNEIGYDNTFLLREAENRIPLRHQRTRSWHLRQLPETYSSYDWRGWNYADWRNIQ